MSQNLGLLLGLLGGLLLMPDQSIAQPVSSSDPTGLVPSVVTTGTATLKVAPDLAFVSLATSARAPQPAAAQRQSADAMAAVRKALRAASIADDRIRTTRYDVQPQFDYVNGRQVSRGYLASNAIEVRIEDLDRVGAVLDAVVGAGATEISGIHFDVKNRGALEAEALKQAVAAARVKADAAAAGAGRTVEAILRIDEAGADVQFPQPGLLRMTADRAAAEPTPIAPGEIEVTARVTLTARLNRP